VALAPLHLWNSIEERGIGYRRNEEEKEEREMSLHSIGERGGGYRRREKEEKKEVKLAYLPAYVASI
jgi:hypothetical protein